MNLHSVILIFNFSLLLHRQNFQKFLVKCHFGSLWYCWALTASENPWGYQQVFHKFSSWVFTPGCIFLSCNLKSLHLHKIISFCFPLSYQMKILVPQQAVMTHWPACSSLRSRMTAGTTQTCANPLQKLLPVQEGQKNKISATSSLWVWRLKMK